MTIDDDSTWWEESLLEEGQEAHALAFRVKMVNADTIWITREGREIPMSLLEDDHLRNCVRMLKRNGQEKSTVYRELLREAAKRGDAAWLDVMPRNIAPVLVTRESPPCQPFAKRIKP
jgi:hypothetical protein